MQSFKVSLVFLSSAIITVSMYGSHPGDHPASKPDGSRDSTNKFSVMADNIGVKSSEGYADSLSTRLINIQSAQTVMNLDIQDIKKGQEAQGGQITQVQRDLAQAQTNLCNLSGQVNKSVVKGELLDAKVLVTTGADGAQISFVYANNKRLVDLETQVNTSKNTILNLTQRLTVLEKFKTDAEAEQQKKALHKEEHALPFSLLNTGAAVLFVGAAVAYSGLVTPWVRPYAPLAYKALICSAKYLPLIAAGLCVTSIAADSTIRCEKKNIDSARTSWQEYFAAKNWFKDNQRPSDAFLYMSAIGAACGHTFKRIGKEAGNFIMAGAALNMIIALGFITGAAAMQKATA